LSTIEQNGIGTMLTRITSCDILYAMVIAESDFKL